MRWCPCTNRNPILSTKFVCIVLSVCLPVRLSLCVAGWLVLCLSVCLCLCLFVCVCVRHVRMHVHAYERMDAGVHACKENKIGERIAVDDRHYSSLYTITQRFLCNQSAQLHHPSSRSADPNSIKLRRSCSPPAVFQPKKQKQT